MTKTRVRINTIQTLVAEANSLGLDIRLPRPEGRPLVLLEYKAHETPNPQVRSFQTLRDARDCLLELCEGAKAQNELAAEAAAERYENYIVEQEEATAKQLQMQEAIRAGICYECREPLPYNQETVCPNCGWKVGDY